MTKLVKELQARDVAIYIAQVRAPVVEFSRRTDLYDLIGEAHIFLTVDAAVQAAEAVRNSSDRIPG